MLLGFYIYRNPKDEIVSWYKFCQSLPIKEIEPFKSMITNGWNKFFEHVVAGIDVSFSISCRNIFSTILVYYRVFNCKNKQALKKSLDR